MTSGIYPEFAMLVTNLYAPPGTRIPMHQGVPPLGWTVDTSSTYSDCSMRVNSNGGGAAGGSTGWSAWNFGGTFGVTGFTLSVAQLAAHNHGISDPGHGHGISDGGHNHNIQGASSFNAGAPGQGGSAVFGNMAGTVANFATTGANNQGNAGLSINGSGTGVSTQNAGSTSGIFPTYVTPQVKFTDFSIMQKS